MNLKWDGRVYQIDPRRMKVERLIDSKIRFTNGIAFGIDNTLYANASFTGEIYRYDVFGPRKPTREVFGNVLQKDKQTGFKGPDGMASREVTLIDVITDERAYPPITSFSDKEALAY